MGSGIYSVTCNEWQNPHNKELSPIQMSPTKGFNGLSEAGDKSHLPPAPVLGPVSLSEEAWSSSAYRARICRNISHNLPCSHPIGEGNGRKPKRKDTLMIGCQALGRLMGWWAASKPHQCLSLCMPEPPCPPAQTWSSMRCSYNQTWQWICFCVLDNVQVPIERWLCLPFILNPTDGQ